MLCIFLIFISCRLFVVKSSQTPRKFKLLSHVWCLLFSQKLASCSIHWDKARCIAFKRLNRWAFANWRNIISLFCKSTRGALTSRDYLAFCFSGKLIMPSKRVDTSWYAKEKFWELRRNKNVDKHFGEKERDRKITDGKIFPKKRTVCLRQFQRKRDLEKQQKYWHSFSWKNFWKKGNLFTNILGQKREM